MICPTCLNQKLVTRDEPGGARAEVCTACVGSCSLCRGTGWAYRKDDAGYTFAEPCACRGLTRRAELFNLAHLPGRFHNAKLVNFEERIDGHHTIIEYLVDWQRNFAPGVEGILLHGPTGIGKTHLICSLLRHVTLTLGQPARFVDFFQLLGQIRDAYSAKRSELAVLGPLLETPLLAIDELGKGKSGEWERGVLDQLISHRYNQQLTTLFTTNHPLEADSAERAVSGRLLLRSPEDIDRVLGTAPLEERVGVRIFSRIREMCRPIAMGGAADIRLERLAPEPVGD